MPDDKVYAFPNQTAPSRPATFDTELCTGCNSCVDACQCDVYMPNPEKGKTPPDNLPRRMLVLRLLRGQLPHRRSH